MSTKKTKKKTLAIPPDAVRVWRGYRSDAIDQATFFQRLGTVFVPSTVEMQIEAGLDTYIPTVPCGMANKPTTTPDETAILFWDSQETYTNCFQLLACRTYTLTHGACYTPQSNAAFPLPFSGSLTPEQPVYLIPKTADWMHGKVTHVVGGRPANVQPADFINNVTAALKPIQTSKVDGAICCAGNDYVVYWVLNDKKNTAGTIAALCEWNYVVKPKSYTLKKGLWEKWPGMTVNPGSSFNMQFKRRWES